MVAGEQVTVDVAVVGGGPVGRSAAVAAARRGTVGDPDLPRMPRPALSRKPWARTCRDLPPAVRVLAGFEAAAIYRGGRLLVAVPHDGGPTKLIEPGRIVLATGRQSVPPLVPGADLPGVLDLPTAVRLLHRAALWAASA